MLAMSGHNPLDITYLRTKPFSTVDLENKIASLIISLVQKFGHGRMLSVS